MIVWLVAFQDTLKSELADTQHLVLLVHHTLRPVFPTFIFKHTQVQDLSNPKGKETDSSQLSYARSANANSMQALMPMQVNTKKLPTYSTYKILIHPFLQQLSLVRHYVESQAGQPFQTCILPSCSFINIFIEAPWIKQGICMEK